MTKKQFLQARIPIQINIKFKMVNIFKNVKNNKNVQERLTIIIDSKSWTKNLILTIRNYFD